MGEKKNKKIINKNFLFLMLLLSPFIPISLYFNISKLIELNTKYNFEINIFLIFFCIYIIFKYINKTLIILEFLFLEIIYNKIIFLLILISPLIIIYFCQDV